METNEDNFICPICGNSDQRYIGYLNSKPYCRKCISFKGELVDDFFKTPDIAEYKLDYELSSDQKNISNELVSNYKKGINTLVNAVCGSGKTEIVLEVIRYAIECGDKVGFALPRRDVAIELFARFSLVFKKNSISLVYGGHHDKLVGDLIILTTHQLYRYNNFFDLLIVDEVDAFPFKGNEVLQSFFVRSLKGSHILLSATPSKESVDVFKKNGGAVVSLFSRYHKHPLPVPVFMKSFSLFIYVILLKTVKSILKENKPLFIFVPTINEAEKTYKILKIYAKSGTFVHSKCKDRTEKIDDFREKKYKYLVTTSVLERGVTVKDLQVIVFKSDHPLYDRYSLVQIAGRVGRKKDSPDGKVIFISNSITEEMRYAKEDIIYANRHL